MVNTCKIIALEGIDGSGKGSQYKILFERLEKEGYRVGKLDFPAYDKFIGTEIGKLLSGDYEVTAKTLDPKSMALWYACDRLTNFKNFDFSKYDILLLNRSSLSNAVYQGVRCSEDRRKDFMKWVSALEFDELGIPEPDMYVIFDITVEQSFINVGKKGHRDYVGEKADVYEADKQFMSDVRNGYLGAAEVFNNAKVLKCNDENGMLDMNYIADMVYKTIAEVI